MSVYRKREGEPYTFDFQFKGNRFCGPTGCVDKREAEKFEKAERARVKASLRDGTLAVVKPAELLTVGQAVFKFHDERAQFHANSDDAMRYLLWIADHIEGGPDLPLTKVDIAKITKLFAKRRGTPTRRGTAPSNALVNRHFEYFRMMMAQAKDVWKIIVQDIEWSKVRLKEKMIITEASPLEEQLLLTHIRPDYVPVLRFALLCGCRLEEIVSLEWTDVRFTSRDFTVWGKGKDGLKKSRTIPMTQEVYDLLWSQKDNHPTIVFTYIAKRSRDGRKKDSRYPITYTGLEAEFANARRRCEKAGHSFKSEGRSAGGYRFHDNRHTAATRLVRATGNLKHGQQFLGHATLETTGRYAHVTTDDLRAGLEAASPSKSPSEQIEPSKVLK